MRDQVRDRFLRNNPCRRGLCVIGGYSCHAWDGDDSRKLEAHRLSPVASEAGTQAELNEQARCLIGAGMTIRALVLDATLRGDGPVG